MKSHLTTLAAYVATAMRVRQIPHPPALVWNSAHSAVCLARALTPLLSPGARLATALWLIVLVLVSPPMSAAVTEAWVQRYNSPANRDERPTAVAVDSSGNVVVTGASAGDCYTAKYAATNGALLWQRRYTGGGGHAVCVDATGNVVVTGGTGSYPNSGYYTAKYAATNGALLWEKRYSRYNVDDLANLAVDGRGNVVVGGTTFDETNSNYYTAKYAAADGALLWERYYNGPANGWDRIRALAVDGSGNVVVTGVSNNGSNGDYYTAKYAAADGALLWERRYDAPQDSRNGGDQALAVAVDGSNNVVVTGYSWSDATFYDYYTAKYAAEDGALLWEQRGPDGDHARGVAVDGSGNVVVTGYSHNGTNYDFYTAKYAAADGALLWEKRYNGPGNGDDEAGAVAVDGSGNVVVTGYSHNGTNSDFYTAKYAAVDGALLWEKRYNGTANGDDLVGAYPTGSSHSLALGPNGMVVITGMSQGYFNFALTYDYATVVYWEPLSPVAIDLVPTGVRLRFSGVPGSNYNIQRALALTGPWSTLATSMAPFDGLIEYVDSNSPTNSAFYRTSTP